LPMSSFSGEAASGASVTPSGTRLVSLVLLDQTAVHTAQEGKNTIFMDNLVIR